MAPCPISPALAVPQRSSLQTFREALHLCWGLQGLQDRPQRLPGPRHPQMRTAVILPQHKVRGQCYALHHPTSHTTNTAHQHPGSGMGKLSHALPLMPKHHWLFLQAQQSYAGHRNTQGTCARLSPPQLYVHTSCTAALDHQTQQGDSGRASSATNPASASQKRWLHPHEQPGLSTGTDGNI